MNKRINALIMSMLAIMLFVPQTTFTHGHAGGHGFHHGGASHHSHHSAHHHNGHHDGHGHGWGRGGWGYGWGYGGWAFLGGMLWVDWLALNMSIACASQPSADFTYESPDDGYYYQSQADAERAYQAAMAAETAASGAEAAAQRAKEQRARAKRPAAQAQ